MKLLSTLLALALSPSAVFAAAPMEEASSPPASHVMMRASELSWGAAPPVLPAGAEATILSGDLSQPGLFTIRLKAPAGYRIPRHWHPTDEHVTVIEGDVTLSMGQGDSAHDASFGPDDYVLLPAKMQHEASTHGGMVVQIHGTGPFEINYIDPKDDPRNAMPEAPH